MKIADNYGSEINITSDVKNAVKGADVIYTDVWISMGDEEETEKDYMTSQITKSTQNSWN